MGGASVSCNECGAVVRRRGYCLNSLNCDGWTPLSLPRAAEPILRARPHVEATGGSLERGHASADLDREDTQSGQVERGLPVHNTMLVAIFASSPTRSPVLYLMDQVPAPTPQRRLAAASRPIP